MGKQLFICTHGREDPERAILPFIAANVAALAGQEAAIVLTIEGVRIATKGYAGGIEKEGMPKLSELITEFVDNGGQLWACQACTKPRGITEADLIKGATIVGAAKVVEEISLGAVPVSFA